MHLNLISFAEHFQQHVSLAAGSPHAWRLRESPASLRDFSLFTTNQELCFFIVNKLFLELQSKHLPLTDQMIQIVLTSLKACGYKGILKVKRKKEAAYFPVSSPAANGLALVQVFLPYVNMENDYMLLHLPHNNETITLHLEPSFSKAALHINGERHIVFENKTESEAFFQQFEKNIQPLKAANKHLLSVFQQYDAAAFQIKDMYYYVFENKQTVCLYHNVAPEKKKYEAMLLLDRILQPPIKSGNAEDLIQACALTIRTHLQNKRLKALLENRVHNMYFQICFRLFQKRDITDEDYQGKESALSVKQYVRKHAADFALREFSLKETQELNDLFSLIRSRKGSKPSFLPNQAVPQTAYSGLSFGKYVFIRGENDSDKDGLALYVFEKEELNKEAPDNFFLQT